MHNSALDRGFASLMMALFTVSLGCGSGSSDRKLPIIETPGVSPENFEGRVLECPSNLDVNAPPAWYAVDAMTRKLQRYPTFAAYVGLDSVTSCDEALAYVRTYNEYSILHPNFEEYPDPKEASPDFVKQEIMPRLKIRGGIPYTEAEVSFPDNPSPIVRIYQAYWTKASLSHNYNYFCDVAKSCTGNVIAKNWILTAAHCLQRAHLTELPHVDPETLSCPDGGQPRSPYATDDYRGKASWIVRWADPTPAKVDNKYVPNKKDDSNKSVAVAFDVYQYPFPGWNGSNELDHDLGLLRIPDRMDKYLPSDVSLGAAAWLTACQNRPEEIYMAGYGAWVTGGVESPLSPLTYNRGPGKNDFTWTTFEGYHTYATDMEVAACSGDSGGPLFRVFNRPTTAHGVTKNVAHIAIQAIASRFTIGDAGAGQSCPETGEIGKWERVNTAVALSWIEESMKDWNEGPCRPVEFLDPDPYYTSINYKYFGRECWGVPCTDDTGCPKGQSCIQSGARLNLEGVDCTATCGKKACDCVIGRCGVPKYDGGVP
jgi:hypothetical protein